MADARGAPLGRWTHLLHSCFYARPTVKLPTSPSLPPRMHTGRSIRRWMLGSLVTWLVPSAAAAAEFPPDCLPTLLGRSIEGPEARPLFDALGKPEVGRGWYGWPAHGLTLDYGPDLRIVRFRLYLKGGTGPQGYRTWTGKLPFGLGLGDITDKQLMRKIPGAQKGEHRACARTAVFRVSAEHFDRVRAMHQLILEWRPERPDPGPWPTQCPSAGAGTPSGATGCLRGTCGTGEGQYVTPQGDRYEGHFRDGQYQGKGRLVTPDGYEYQGEFDRGRKWGQGRLSYKGKLVYEGGWVDGKKWGNGRYFGPRGEGPVQEGRFENDRFVPPPVAGTGQGGSGRPATGGGGQRPPAETPGQARNPHDRDQPDHFLVAAPCCYLRLKAGEYHDPPSHFILVRLKARNLPHAEVRARLAAHYQRENASWDGHKCDATNPEAMDIRDEWRQTSPGTLVDFLKRLPRLEAELHVD